MKLSSEHIQPAAPENIDSLVLLINGAYRGKANKPGWTNECEILEGPRIDRAGIEMILNDERARLFVYIYENHLVGCILAEAKQEGIYLSLLAVDPTYQSSGLGKLLMETAEDYGRSLGYLEAYGTVITLRKDLLEAYKDLGYLITEEESAFPVNANVGTPLRDLRLVKIIKPLYQ